MSLREFDDDCPGCRPAILDLKTGKQVPMNSAAQQAVERVWARTSFEERRAFHRVCCQNSKNYMDLFLMVGLARKFREEAEKQ